MTDLERFRSHFPILKTILPTSKPLIYFDNAATTQLPDTVINRLVELYTSCNANIHRGVHYMSSKTTELYEAARERVRRFLNAPLAQEIIFTHGTTDSINLIANSLAFNNIKEGDEVLISQMEHHSNLVPWQMICEKHNAQLKFIPLQSDGSLNLDELPKLLSDRTKVLSITIASNTLGTINPVKKIIAEAHKNNTLVVLDAAQAAPHLVLDVQELDCDFLALSAHKIFAPTGLGILFGKKKYLDELPPYQGGGDMVECVTLAKTTYNQLPFKFEAGTTNYIAAIAFSTALDFLEEHNTAALHAHEQELTRYTLEKFSAIPNLRLIGNATAENRTPTISFILENIHAHDMALILDKLGIAVRTGTHCTQPIMDFFGIESTVRVSFAPYNTFEEVDLLMSSLARIIKMFNK